MSQKLTKKQQTRKRMLDAAGQSFRSNGYTGIGVDGIAKAAGVTSGAFYAHFGSKDGAFRAALSAGLDEVIAAVPAFQREYGAKWVEEFARYYLGKPHRDDLACGCAMTGLTPDVVRSEPEVQEIYEQKMTEIAGLIAAGLAQGSDADRLGRAWSLLGVLIGGLSVARAMGEAEITESIAAAVISTAVGAAGSTKGVSVTSTE